MICWISIRVGWRAPLQRIYYGHYTPLLHNMMYGMKQNILFTYWYYSNTWGW